MHDGIQSPINPFSPLFPPIYGEQGVNIIITPRVGISILYPAWGVINIITLTTGKESQR